MDLEGVLTTVYGFSITYGIKLLGAILIFIVGKWLSGLVSRFIETLMIKAKVDKTLTGFTRNIAYSGLMVFVVIAALNKLGVQTTSLVAILGAAGLAVGLALQGSLANFAAGVLLVIFKPFKVGDFIQAGGVMGTVDEIQIFNTVISAPDNRREIVPNAQVTGGSITNFSAIKKRRIDLTFGISYEDNIKMAKDVLLEVVNADSRILKDPVPVVAVSELADSSVNLVCRPWVKPADYWDVYFEILEKGKEALEKKGITIPFPQNDVHLYQEKSKEK